MFKPSFLKYSIYFKMPIDIPLWETNTGQKRSFFVGPKISPVSSKKFLEVQATLECRFTLKRARDMMRTYSQINPSNKYVKQRLLYAYFEEKYFTSSINIS